VYHYMLETNSLEDSYAEKALGDPVDTKLNIANNVSFLQRRLRVS